MAAIANLLTETVQVQL